MWLNLVSRHEPSDARGQVLVQQNGLCGDTVADVGNTPQGRSFPGMATGYVTVLRGFIRVKDLRRQKISI